MVSVLSRLEQTVARVLVLCACLLLVVVGSLYPFEFDWSLSVWRFRGLHALPGKSDSLANWLLFLPFGMAVSLCRMSWRWRVLWVLLGLSVALGAQVAQVFLPSRFPAIWDAVINAFGLASGLCLGLLIPRRQVAAAWEWRLPLVAFTPLSLLLAYELMPLVPTLNIGLLKGSIRRIFQAPVFRPEDFVHAMSCILILYAVLISSIERLRARIWLGLTGAIVVTGQVLVFAADATIAAHIGYLFGIGFALLWMPTRVGFVLAALLSLGFYIGDGLTPLVAREQPLWPSLIPLDTLLGGNWMAGMQTLLWKGFLFSSVLVLMRSVTGKDWPGIVLVLGVALVVEGSQVFFASGSASTLDLYLAGALSMLIARQGVSDGAKPPGRTVQSVPLWAA